MRPARALPLGTGSFAIVALTLCFSLVADLRAAQFPIAGDGTYVVNVIRRYDNVGPGGSTVFLPSIVSTSGPGVGQSTATIFAIDGGNDKLQWDGTAPADPSETGSITITLDSIYSLKKFKTEYFDPGYTPAQYQIRTSTNGSSWTVAVPYAGGPAGTQTDTLASPVSAKYIEYTWKGTNATQYVLLREFQAYADAATNPFPLELNRGWDLVAKGGVTAATSSGNWQPDNPMNLVDLDHTTYLRGNGGGDATADIDLGSTFLIGAVSLSFFQGQSWGSGVKIELSADGTSWTTGFNQLTDTSSYLSADVTDTMARYIRLTNYGGSSGALTDLQVFAVPEPTAAMGMLFALVATTSSRVRRRKSK